MISASLPVPVFMKYCLSLPSSSLVVIFEVEADDMPAPPWLETLVLAGSRESSLTTALSSFMADAIEGRFLIRDNMDCGTYRLYA